MSDAHRAPVVKPLTFKTRTGLVLHASSYGAPESTPALALHGWLDNAASFAPLAPLLGGRRLIALDLPGHGRSEHLPAAASRNFVDWLPHVLDALDALELERVTLVGHSMGAGIASLFAGAMPERVDKLVLIEGLGPLSTPAAQSVALMRESLAQRDRAVARAARRVDDLTSAVARMKAARMPMSNGALELIARRNTRELDSGGLEFTYDPMLQSTSLVRLTEEHVLELFAAITAPTLFVQAEEGLPFPQEMMRTRLEAISNLVHHKIPGGHHVHMDTPRVVAELVADFLET